MDKKTQILFCADNFYPSFDGPAVLIDKCAQEINKNDCFKAELVVPNFPHYKDHNTSKITRIFSIKAIDNFRMALPFFSKKLNNLFKNNNYDIVHVHSPFTLGRAVIKKAKKHKIPVVFTMHTKFKEDTERLVPIKFLRKLVMKYIMKTINMADYVLSVSNATIETLKSYGYNKEIGLIRNGSDFQYPKQPQALINDINEKYNILEAKSVFVTVARLVSNKRLEFILDILEELKNMNVDFKMFMVGNGSFESKLKQLTKQKNLSDNVIFTGKILDRNTIAGFYLRSDLMIFPSVYDNASLTLMEAASMKTPSILQKYSSTAEIIEDNVTGFLGDGTAKEWANKIERILKNKSRLVEVGQNAEKIIYRTWNTVAEEHLEFYNKIIKVNSK